MDSAWAAAWAAWAAVAVSVVAGVATVWVSWSTSRRQMAHARDQQESQLSFANEQLRQQLSFQRETERRHLRSLVYDAALELMSEVSSGLELGTAMSPSVPSSRRQRAFAVAYRAIVVGAPASVVHALRLMAINSGQLLEIARLGSHIAPLGMDPFDPSEKWEALCLLARAEMSADIHDSGGPPLSHVLTAAQEASRATELYVDQLEHRLAGTFSVVRDR